MGQKYSSNSSSGYNATPPADDGTVSEANKGKWSTIKEKLADPVKTLADTINTDLVEHFDNGPVAYTSNQTIGASHYGKVIQVSGAANTQTLTDAATLGAGWNCEFVSTDTTNTVTIARATASDMVNETTANISLLPLQSVKAVVNASANGFLVSSQIRKNKTSTISEVNTFAAIQKFSKGADVASATALTLGTDGNYFDITGTTTITSIATLGIGAVVKLHFDGALTLTHHATDLILPGGANIVTAAGDEAELIEYASGDWRCTNYKRATDAEFIIASATTTDIGSSSSDNVQITGTTTITGFGTTAAGVRRNIRFAGALTLTNNGVSLIIPGGANITTAGNDIATVMSLGSGNWIVTNYQKASGGAISIVNSSITQTKLAQTFGDVSVGGGGSTQATLPGGAYGFYPQVFNSISGVTGNIVSIAVAADTLTTGAVTNVRLDATAAAQALNARQTYITACPPYDLGDGEIPLFVFAVINASGIIESTYVAPEAPWHYNGPTDIRAERYMSDRRGYRTVKQFMAEHGSIKDALAKGLTRDQIADQIYNSPMVEIEITQSIKNADMPLIPHPFTGNNMTGKTVVLLDPVSPLVQKLSVLHGAGESISELLHSGYLIVNNSALVRRKGPIGVQACSCRWKLT